MTPPATPEPSHRLREVEVLTGRDSLARYLPAVGSLDFDAGTGAEHVDLPSDVFTVAIHCGDDAQLVAQLDNGLQVVISPVREQARRFAVQGRSRIAVATLTPLGMLHAFGAGHQGVFDQPVPLEHVCGRAQERRLAQALHTVRTLPQRAEAFARWLEERVAEQRGVARSSQRVVQAAQALAELPAQPAQVVDVAGQLGVTRRQLERDFRAQLGVSPVSYSRLARFQRAAAAVASGQNLLHAALDHGFADQSHMNRAFREFALVTPRELARDGARPGRDRVRAGLGGRVFMLDAQRPAA